MFSTVTLKLSLSNVVSSSMLFSQRKESQKDIARKLYTLILEKLQSWQDKHIEMKNYKGEGGHDSVCVFLLNM